MYGTNWYIIRVVFVGARMRETADDLDGFHHYFFSVPSFVRVEGMVLLRKKRFCLDSRQRE